MIKLRITMTKFGAIEDERDCVGHKALVSSLCYCH